jgi:hypothetical protein
MWRGHCFDILRASTRTLFSMKNILFFLFCVGAIFYFFFVRKPDAAQKSAPAPAATVKVSSASSAAPAQPAGTPTNFLKRPLDRARDVSEIVKKRAADVP